MPALSSIVDSHFVKALVCVADGNLFPSDLPVRRARARVVNDFLASFGVRARYDDRTLPAVASAASFRAAALALAASHGIPMAPELTAGACLAAPVAVAAGAGPIAAGSAPVAVASAPVAVAAVPGLAPGGAAGAPTGGERLLDAGALGRWSELEEVAVADYLACCLQPDRTVLDAVGRLAVDYRIGAIGLCGPSRLDACLAASRLEQVVPADHRLCMELDDGDAPEGPARETYELACERLGLRPEDVVAVAHTRDGVLGARAAGIRTIGNLHYVTARHRGARAVELARAGAVVVVRNWSTLARLLRCLPWPA